MEIKAVIFDMDGVISDSETLALKLMPEILEKYNLPKDFDTYSPLIGINEQLAIEYLTTITKDQNLSIQIIKEFDVGLHKALVEGQVPLKKGAIELIDKLNEKNVPIALATSSQIEKVNYTFRGNGYEVPFKVVVTGDMVTHSKPDPEIFLLAASKLNINIENCLVIEDSYNGIKAALEANAISCMVPDVLQPTEEILNSKTIIKNDLIEVEMMLKQLSVL